VAATSAVSAPTRRYRPLDQGIEAKLSMVLANGDPWRARLRDPAVLKDQKSLQALADDPQSLNQPPRSITILAYLLTNAKAPEAAILLLKMAQRRFPSDFMINNELQYALRQCQPPRIEEAIRFSTAAVAIQPQSPGVHNNHGGLPSQSPERCTADGTGSIRAS
jgi:hypothetical protein